MEYVFQSCVHFIQEKWRQHCRKEKNINLKKSRKKILIFNANFALYTFSDMENIILIRIFDIKKFKLKTFLGQLFKKN
jgi:hypothetical protein